MSLNPNYEIRLKQILRMQRDMWGIGLQGLGLGLRV